MAFLEGQYNLNKTLINSPANHGVFFADTDALVTKMYAQMYAEDESCAITQEEYERVASMADELTRKSRWDKIFCLVPKNTFVDDHTRFMNHADMDSRNELLHKLVAHMTEAGLMDKVVFLEGGNYYENFMTIVKYVREIMAR
jgi:nicotinamide riboside kinase